MRFATLGEWLAWQETLHPRAIDLTLDRVRGVAATLDVLSFGCPVITVAGTNGKGSCVAMLDAILRAGGYRVGAFTSPHLLKYNERIHIDGVPVEDAALMAAFERIDTARGDVSLTFFEFNALAALLLFKAQALDAVILEVGLGGRLDAVNVVDADVALIASIGFDHCDWLGHTLEEIGREKAGILRTGRPAIFGGEHPPASIVARAHDIGAALRVSGVDFDHSVVEGRLSWWSAAARLSELPLPALQGPRQSHNAAAVLTVLHELRMRLPLAPAHIAQGLRTVSLPGRFQVLGSGPQWILDVAHNPDAAAALAAQLKRSAGSGRTFAIAGILRDKDAPAVVAPLLNVIDVWIAVGLSGERGTSAQELIDRIGLAASGWLLADDVEAACERAARLAAADDRIVIFGSFHTVGPALRWLETATLPA